MKHRPRKRFGQNFLQDERVIDAIIQAINPQPNQSILEIGPGQGAITRPLLESGADLTLIELDRDLIAHLEQLEVNHRFARVIQGDVLKLNLADLNSTDAMLVVGNLPYNISTPVIFHLLASLKQIDTMVFMLQKEVVERLCAEPGGGTYGRLSVMVQYHCQAEMLIEVPPEAFFPAPKVDSAVVRLTPYKESKPWPEVSPAQLSTLVAKAFGQRRKTLRNNLKGLLTAEQISQLGIDPGIRPEKLRIADFVQLAQVIE